MEVPEEHLLLLRAVKEVARIFEDSIKLYGRISDTALDQGIALVSHVTNQIIEGKEAEEGD